MNEQITRQRYAPTSIVLHWTMLLLITGAYTCVLLHENFERDSDLREGLKAWHFMLGLTILMLVIVRIAARFFHCQAADHAAAISIADAYVQGRALGALCIHAGDAAAGLDYPACAREDDPVLWTGTVSAGAPG